MSMASFGSSEKKFPNDLHRGQRPLHSQPHDTRTHADAHARTPPELAHAPGLRYHAEVDALFACVSRLVHEGQDGSDRAERPLWRQRGGFVGAASAIFG